MRSLERQATEAYRRRLQRLRRDLAREYWNERQASRAQAKESPEDSVDLAERSYERDYLLSLSEREREQLLQIEDALGRIERGEYAICCHCGSGIPASRLDAVPWARFCIVCQGLQEEGLLARWGFTPRAAAGGDADTGS